MARRIILGLTLALLAGLVAWALWPKPIAAETAAIGRRGITVFAEEEGKSRIREVFTVSAPISGQMERVNLHAGDEVKGGETVIASMRPASPPPLDARTRRVAEAIVSAAQAAVELANVRIRQVEAQLSFLQSELERAITLAARGTIPERALEKAKLDADTAMAEVASAKAALLVRRQELESAEAALIEGGGDTGAGPCCIPVKAPVSGRVLRVLAESEQVVQAGTPLVEIGDPSDLEIVTELLSRDAVRIAAGAAAAIDGWGGEPLAAAVERIDPLAVTKVSALGIEEQRVAVILRLKGDPKRWAGLGHDFRVVVRITVWRGADLIAVPIGALFRAGADWTVFTVNEGVARTRTVTIGHRNSDYAEVTGGLAEGETVILHPSDQIAEGVRIEVRDAD